jgi:hypothetical protein
MFTLKMNMKAFVGIVLTLVLPLASQAYSSAAEIKEFLAKNNCRILARNSADNSEKYRRDLNWETETKNSSMFVKKARIEASNNGNEDHIFVPAPSSEVGVPAGNLGVDEEFYIYFDLNKSQGVSGKTLLSDLFIRTNNTFTEVPVKLENFATNEAFSLKFRTQMNTDRYYFLQCFPKN